MNILFLCTGNSCRSQMAEGWARYFSPNWLEVCSAGSEAHGKNPRAITVMAEVGIDIAGQDSTIVTNDTIQDASVVVTLCGHADDHCPVLPAGTSKEHWPLDDPAKATGTEIQIMAVFRATRDDIRQRVRDLLDRLQREYER